MMRWPSGSRRTRIGVVLVLASALLAVAGFGSAASHRHFEAGAQPRASVADATSTGEFAVAFGAGHTARPRGLRLRIASNPEQWITAVWVVTCHRGFALETTGGSASGRSPLVRQLPLPLLWPERCSVFAGGQLEGTGAISVRVAASRAGDTDQ